MESRNWRQPMAALVPIAAAASIVPLQAGSCGPDPVHWRPTADACSFETTCTQED